MGLNKEIVYTFDPGFTFMPPLTHFEVLDSFQINSQYSDK